MNWMIRIALLTLIILAGTAAALFTGETTGMALNDLSGAPISAMSQPDQTDTVFAAIDGQLQGIFRSDDGGRSWQQVSTGPEAEVSALAVHPVHKDIMFAGTNNPSGSNLWVSGDGGKTWDSNLFAMPADESGVSPVVSALSAVPDQPDLMYLGTWGRGLYRFDVREGRMELVGGQSRADLYINKIVANPDSPVYAVTTEGLMRINGIQMQKLKTPDGVVSLAVDPTNPKTLYLGTVGYGLHRSVDGGQSWQALNSDLGLAPGVILRIPAVAIDKQNPQHLPVTTAFGVGSQVVGDGLFESFDGGQSWNRLADLSEIVNKLSIKSGSIYAATSNGLVQYGQPAAIAETLLQQRLESLANPTRVQWVILLLTAMLGIWILFARLPWASVWVKN